MVVKISTKMKMPVFVLLMFFCMILAEERSDLFFEHKQECAKEFPVDESILKKLHEGEEVEVDENTKCFTKCILEKSGHIDKDGNSQLTKHEESHPHFANLKMAFEKCKPDAVKSCDDAFELKKCVTKELKESMKDN